MILPITLTIAAAATLLNLWLAWRVSQLRRAYKVSVGDGGHEALLRRMRAQANYGEHAPFFLILVALIELATGGSLWLWGAAILFVLARIAHAIGMDQPSPARLRVIGMIGSTLMLIGLAGWAIFLAYQAPELGRGILISPGYTA